MKDSLFAKKIEYQRAIARLNQRIKELQDQVRQLKAKEKVVDSRIHLDMLNNNVSSYQTLNYQFELSRDVISQIIESERETAMKYDKRYQIGLFHTVINGMRLKQWVRKTLEQNQKPPSFVKYDEFVKIIAKPLSE